MTDKLPLVITAAGQIQQIQTDDTVGILHGGTGATTQGGAQTALGLAIGTNVQAHDATLTAVAALTGAGYMAFSATDTPVMRTLTGSTRITVSNGTGTVGNPVWDLSSYADGAAGTFLKLTRDSQGLVSGTTAVVAGDITALVDATYVNVSGDTMTNFLTLHADPSSALHAATKQYVDSTAAGQRVRNSVRVATTANITLSAPQTIDGVSAIAGERVLVKDQSTGANNGVYIVAAGAWTRATDFDSASGEVVGGSTFWVNEGTANGDTGWTLTTNDAIVVGTTALVFTQSSGLGQVTAGSGLTKTGNQLDVGSTGGGSLTIGADTINLTGSIVTPGTYTKITVDTYGRATTGATATPADIGAQASDAGLTSLAALTGGGGVFATATDTFVMRNITGTAGRITVTNGDGVAGAPTIDLVSGIVTPGTYNSLTVDTYGRATAGTTSSSSNLTDSFVNNNGGTVVRGRAVYAHTTTNRFDLAIGNAAAAAQAIGIVSDASIATTASGNIIVAGVASFTTAEWDVVTGQTGGLTAGSMYYLDNATGGKYTTTAPSTGYICAIGKAISTTKMILRFDPTIQL